MTPITKALTLHDLPAPPPGKTGWPWTEQSKPVGDRISDGSKYPRISIVTPSYNQGKFIEETIRSVLLQGYPNLEYIIIDGGSTDNSVEILQKYSPCINYWVSEIDNGQTHAINKGLRIATGSILGWINSDDLYVKNTLQKIARASYHNKSYSVFHGNRILLNERGEVTGLSIPPSFVPEITQYVICSETTFWRKRVMEQAGYLKEELQFAMDLEFFGRLYFYGKFLKINDYLGYFRCYRQNKSSAIPHIKQEESSREWKKLFNTEYRSQPKKISKTRLIREAIARPFLIGSPYIYHKLTCFQKKYLTSR
ncbi:MULTISPECIES: glycosyltransferase family 2 protein [Cyanophyceae]|uniref:glycosyltransferase family 2 protein n=1 Tax=Cyanophyceae TaxID=3028117 RepID=UPI0016853F43|nr:MULTISPECIES: glycosyltransferase family 2 protein [Cyanophyceae]MBD1916317.1 glycosyltransferase [Phormidium sp. FACHB-77]MBD2032609.1 glycosyltransferase [Phormidium sp. FACHB-322]MBD2049981.1 glycosyltransferase [Leptolyngbya sp. FACHB-60]